MLETHAPRVVTGHVALAAGRQPDPPSRRRPARAPASSGILSAPDPARSTKEDDMADEASTRVRSMVEKLLEADMTDQIAQRSREIAEAVSDATDNVTHRAEVAWKDSAPQRREAEKAARHAARDAMRWGRRTWEHDLRPEIRKLWKQRKAAIAAAGAAIPAGRELVEDAAARAGIRERREQRHW